MRGQSSPATITPGSRASRYVGVTAKQLNTSRARNGGTQYELSGSESPTLSKRISSPSLGYTSPRRIASASPYATPKAASGARTFSLGVGMPPAIPPNNPRAASAAARPRVPSNVAMPPPASPSLPSRFTSSDERRLSDALTSDLALNGKALQERIAKLIAEPYSDTPHSNSPTSEVSGENVDERHVIMQSRLKALEEELASLRSTTEHDKSEALRLSVEEQEKLSSRISELEDLSRTLKTKVSERDAAIESLQQSAKQNAVDTERLRSESDARLKDLQAKLDDRDALVTELKKLLEEKDGLQTENDAVIQAKDVEIALLEARVQKACSELEEERKELGMQVDELRKAGQVCHF